MLLVIVIVVALCVVPVVFFIAEAWNGPLGGGGMD